MEAMACGVPVIATNTGGTPELVRHMENGLLIEAGDHVELARHIRMLALDPVLAQRLADAGRETVVSHFTMTRMLDEMEAFLEDVVADASGVKRSQSSCA
jgi:glycosyltransferase involved in cell wall biosynthesis